MLPVTLIARLAGRSLGLSRRAILLGLGRAARRQYRIRTQATPDPLADTHRAGRALAGAAYAAWLCGLTAFVLVVLNVHLFFPAGTAISVYRLAVGTILLVEGIALVVERSLFRRLLRARLTMRPPGRSSLLRAGRRPFVGPALTVVGIAFVAGGILNVLRGAVALL